MDSWGDRFEKAMCDRIALEIKALPCKNHEERIDCLHDKMTDISKDTQSNKEDLASIHSKAQVASTVITVAGIGVWEIIKKKFKLGG